MPRRVAPQVADSVSRLIAGGFIKAEPAWYAAALQHPTAPLPARFPRPGKSQNAFIQKIERGRKPTKTDRRSAIPNLNPRPITYLEDKVRAQFYRDHPWEAKTPRTLVEPGESISAAESSRMGKAKELRHWGRNPGPEDVVTATLELHQAHELSLSAAYHTTLASYYALRAEHENASRYAVVEAIASGARFGRTQTQRSFEKEGSVLQRNREERMQQQQLQRSVESATAQQNAHSADGLGFSGGLNYLQAARRTR
ncbi:hypothetical protein K437DRAFT_290897 [Tilletiaria anomala UBC 951]|uniref:Small ribosomal subunit protein mS23 n=1 Tax=Tilletiaria anomala (strain ATCC 24038 / CBS 436.72 / UBC 951) TaxID=1037660 RepID=A0A066VTY0_TILAU|nr:uncharacterized protein K437DRAFT_290897 [Tilletiaria anomala UBC 951]KDN44911.1 hypothetical protein K437DRAFT_290897 [Tilletiaria anomala UBC 951]